jgi:hypothetical protein
MMTANFILPFFLQKKVVEKRRNQKHDNTPFSVCLTSFPQRIGRLHLVIYSLLLQDIKPEKIIIYLSKKQFNSLDALPRKLLKTRKFGVTIRLVEEDLRSYKKYYYYLREEGKDFIIVDDDIFYPSNTFSSLYKTHLTNPNAVCANRCVEIDSSKCYREWKQITYKTPTVSINYLPTGCGGVYYPKGSLDLHLALNDKLFMKLCPDADDIWLNVCAFLNSTAICHTGNFIYYIPVINKNNKTLHSANVGESGNDKKFKLTKDYFINNNNIDILDRYIIEDRKK